MAQPVQLQIAFTKAQEKQNRLKVLKMNLKQMLEDNLQYANATESIENLNAKRRQILNEIKESNSVLAQEIDEIMADLKNGKELMTDLAIRDFVEGKTVAVEDTNGNKYEPVWSVKFKKAKDLFNQS